jgi:outer membrane protein TolC
MGKSDKRNMSKIEVDPAVPDVHAKGCPAEPDLRMQKRFTALIVVAALILTSCSADHHVRQTDRQVQAIIRDRERKALEYTPQVDVPVPVVTPVPKRAYATVPLSPVPPKTVPPIEVERIDIPRTSLGPDLALMERPALIEPSWGEELADRYRPRLPLGPPAPGQTTRQLDLFGCLQYAVQNSRTYQNEMEQLYFSALDVSLERHLFSPRPFASTSIDYSGGQRTSQYRSALAVTNTAGIRQQLPFGGEIVASGLVDFVNALHGNVNDGEEAALVLSGSMPLLRGFGMINLEPLIDSERQLIYQVRDFEDFRRSFVVDIARQYFNLLAVQQGVRNRRVNLATSTDLRIRSQELYNAFKLSFLEVQRARQSELQAQSSVIDSEESYQTALDDFKVSLGMPVDEPMDVVPVQMDVSIPRLMAEDAVSLAHKFRLTLVTAADRVDDATRAVKNSRNRLLPDVELAAQGRLGNENETPARELRGSTGTYEVGVRIDWPIDRVAERNAYRRSLIGLQQAQRNLAAERDRVTADVRDALRTIRAAEISLEISRLGIELAERRMEFANIRLTQGAANSNRDVVEAQTALLDAQDRLERARSQLQVRVLEYMRSTGTLRVDPQAGTIGRVMDRAAGPANNSSQAR